MQDTRSAIPDEPKVRLERLHALKDAGIEPYPSWNGRTHTTEEAREHFETLKEKKATVTLAGRLRSIRNQGGSTFAHLEDASGRMQIYLKKDEVGERAYEHFATLVDIGDFVAATGTLFATKRGEQTLLVKHWQLLAKSLEPLPEKWHGLKDIELRHRKRYLDLLSNPEARKVAETRIKIIRAIRKFFDERGFLEVDTPVLQPLAGGATAKPFVTHHNALDMDLYLRIAPELYLKRLLVGGFERVYEIARCFRNEGIDAGHNPEFTQIEVYQAYANYEDLMAMMEQFFSFLFAELGTAPKFVYQGHTVDMTPPYPRKTFRALLIEHGGIDIEKFSDEKTLYEAAKKKRVEVTPKDSRAKIMDECVKTLVRPHIWDPVHMIDHPVELSPLSKRKADDPRYVERVQLLVGGGFELWNGFSELNDPIDQEARFDEQEKMRGAGDEEAQRKDADFIEALRHGMPPAAGLGMGIDRLVGLLTDQHNIKETILFPTLRPKG